MLKRVTRHYPNLVPTKLVVTLIRNIVSVLIEHPGRDPAQKHRIYPGAHEIRVVLPGGDHSLHGRPIVQIVIPGIEVEEVLRPEPLTQSGGESGADIVLAS